MAILPSQSLLHFSSTSLKLSNSSSTSVINLNLSNKNYSSLSCLKYNNNKEKRRMSERKYSNDDVDTVTVGENLPEDYGDRFVPRDPKDKRRAGILLHPTSLPGPYGIGDLGDQAFRFLDWLHLSGCSVWQVLPLVPPGRRANEEGSPYSGQDANCGNTLLISLEELVKDGLLMKEELPTPLDMERVKFSIVADVKDPLIAKAAERLILSEGELKSQLEDFRKDPEISGWLEDAAYFAAIDNMLNTLSWNEWPEPLRNRHLAALEEIYITQTDFINIFIAQQFLFQKQWQKVRNYAQMKEIKIMGDMPIYVGYHSADVWANKSVFLLNRKGLPTIVSGVPPDAFSETGQLWGRISQNEPKKKRKNKSKVAYTPSQKPLGFWTVQEHKRNVQHVFSGDLFIELDLMLAMLLAFSPAMEANGFSWWVQRIKRAYNLYDEFRIDHFRGFAGFWAVPSESKVAMFGHWKAGPRKAVFDAIFQAVGRINIIAEDLGVITEDVVQLRKGIAAPGMAVLQFAFGDGGYNINLPHNHERNQVVYTGTHDNDTSRGWWESLQPEQKSIVMKYLSLLDGDDISWKLIKAAVSSVAQTAIVPMQDILGLGSSARMNIPATQSGNWNWRMSSSFGLDCLQQELKKLRDMLLIYDRL
ncbi:hypothetical protein IFM89_018971 [Coptis chinensis]|uniref:4-alpha-glucanotransferase n=1 Tax=Coptis chinensis TaxID=261450 RepID=A0A835I242_9MAGN|nr:hypothetical protein IFM89_018971 [Coptis chinensis]